MRDFVDNLIGISLAMFVMFVVAAGWAFLIISVLEYVKYVGGV